MWLLCEWHGPRWFIQQYEKKNYHLNNGGCKTLFDFIFGIMLNPDIL